LFVDAEHALASSLSNRESSTAAAAGFNRTAAARLAAIRLATAMAVVVTVATGLAARLRAANRGRGTTSRLAAAAVQTAVVMTVAAALAAARGGTARGLGSARGLSGSGAGRFGSSGAGRFSGNAATTTAVEETSFALSGEDAEQTDHQQGGQQSTELHDF
jgi:hypothetical protein